MSQNKQAIQEIRMMLRPIKISSKDRYFEIVEISTETTNGGLYPLTFAHIDTFHTTMSRSIYSKLNDGKTLIVDVKFVEDVAETNEINGEDYE